jgi:hypothetical protein
MMSSFPIGFGWKKIDVKQGDKSHVDPLRKEKHVFDLIKMVKKIVSPHKGQKTRKEFSFAYTIFTPMVNKNSGSIERPKK